MICVALTGGIGSGKTTVAKQFIKLGIPVFFADDEAKKLMQNSESLRLKIIEVFGKQSYQNKELNRPYIAELVFKNPEKLKQLNALVHPAVRNHFTNWVKQQQTPYVLYESALVFETNSASEFDLVICVTADFETRINRIINRDNTTRDTVLNRINNQWPEAQKIAKSDIIIENNTGINLEDKALKIHQELLKRAENH